MAGGTCVALSTFAKSAELEYQLRIGDVSLLIFERSVLNRDFAAELIELCPEIATSEGAALLDAAAVPAPCGLHRRRSGAEGRVRVVEGLRSQRRQGVGGARRRDRCRGRADGSRHGVLLVRLDREAQGGPAHASRRRDSMLALDVKSLRSIPTCAPGPPTASSGPATSRRPWAPRLSAGGCLVLQRYFDPGEALRLMQIERVTYPIAWPHQWARLVEDPAWNDVDLSSLHYVGENRRCARIPPSRPIGRNPGPPTATRKRSRSIRLTTAARLARSPTAITAFHCTATPYASSIR